MIRGAAKNFPHVIVVVDPADYEWIGESLVAGKPLTLEQRKKLARKAFQHVALYDTTISQYLGADALELDESTFGFSRLSTLRYGENPHQQAGIYAAPLSTGGIVRAKQLHGIDMSYTNYLDADAAWRVVADFEQPAATVIKHTNPCGLAVHDDQPTAYRRAFEGDSVSAYGGIVAFNRALTAETAQAMRGVLFDIIIAPVLRRRCPRSPAPPPPHSPARSLARIRSTGRLGRPPSIRRRARAADRRHRRIPRRLEGRYRAPAHRRRTRRPRIRVESSQAYQVQHHRSREGQHPRRNGRRPAQPRSQRPPRSTHFRGQSAKGSVLASDAFFPFADNIEMAAIRRHHRNRRTRRLHPRRRGNRCRQRAQHRHALHRHPPLPPLSLYLSPRLG